MRRLTALCLTVCMLAACLLQPVAMLAATVMTGTVYGIDPGSKLYMREGPTTSAKVIHKLDNGDVVTILDTVVEGGTKWYKITVNDLTGYSSAAYIRINASYETDEEFEAYLTAQKFPEDYKVLLRKVHALYPSWIFEAQHLPMTWAEAWGAESAVLKNAIDIDDEPEAWASMEYGAYNWTTGNYVAVDSGGWVTATAAVVAYYMDPRNFLDDTYLFQFEDLRYSDTHTVEGVKAILPSRYDQYAEDLLKAAKEAKVSAYFLATRMTQEGSKIVGTWVGDDGVTYENVYNFFNYGAYAGSQHGSYHGAVTNGAIYAKKQGWNTPYACLVGSAKKIGDGYINKEQNTLYYQKFDVTDGGNGFYGHQYMTNVSAPYSEAAIRARKATDAERASALTFIIPVYKEMPETVAPKPATTGNNNNFLDELSVSGCTLTPSFNRYTLSYAAQVEGEVTEVDIAAVLNHKEAKIAGTGKVKLSPGDNEIPVTVTATSGQARTYTLTITRNAPPDAGDGGEEGGENSGTDKPEPPPEEPKKPQITGKIHLVDPANETVSKIEPETPVSKFLENLAVLDGEARLVDTTGAEKTSGVVVTGDILRIYSGTSLYASYTAILYGDVNCDGKITSQDLRRIQRHILGIDTIEGYFLIAADTNMDGKLSSQDLRKTQLHILGVTASLQSPATTPGDGNTSATTTTATATTATTAATATTTATVASQ